MGIKFEVLFLILEFLLLTSAKPSPGTAWMGRNRTARHLACINNREYQHKSVCCLLCPAGTYVEVHCNSASGQGTCAQCKHGTFTESHNGLTGCLPCGKCRQDEEETKPCVSTQNTQCQCRVGYFCSPDQACEVCKKCSKCKEDEEREKNCTVTSNTVCKRRQPPHTPASRSRLVVAAIAVAVVILVISAIPYLYWRKGVCRKRTEIPNECDHSELVNFHVGGKKSVNIEGKQGAQSPCVKGKHQEMQPFLRDVQVAIGDEDRGLGDSLPNTTTSSQASLSTQPTYHSPGPSPSPETQMKPVSRGAVQYRRLVPLNGQESLKNSFDLFDQELDVRFHNKFFRRIGLSDNAIKNAEHLPPGEKVYELLKTWMEKTGLNADINFLINELVNLDQRFSAGKIISEAVKNGDFQYEEV